MRNRFVMTVLTNLHLEYNTKAATGSGRQKGVYLIVAGVDRSVLCVFSAV
jgi:hypothetical protein